MALQIELDEDPQDLLGGVWVRLEGSLDSATAPKLQQALAPLLARAELRVLALDLERLAYLSSAGLRILLSARRELSARGGLVLLRKLSPGVRRVLQVVKAMEGLREVVTSEEELDDYLARVQGDSLRRLDLYGLAIGDQGLNHLEGLTQLRELNLARTQVGDEGLRRLRGLTSLQELNLYQTPVSDACLEHLAELRALRELNLFGTQVSAEGLEWLRARLPQARVHGS